MDNCGHCGDEVKVPDWQQRLEALVTDYFPNNLDVNRFHTRAIVMNTLIGLFATLLRSYGKDVRPSAGTCPCHPRLPGEVPESSAP